MNSAAIAIASACVASVFVGQRLYIPIKKAIYKTRWKDHRLKPFDCELCLAWWTGIVGGIYFEKNGLEVIYIGACAAVLAVAITKHLNK